MASHARQFVLVFWSLALSALMVPGQALAVDGVILIDQARVMASGGFPYRITQAGSYRLASNLQIPSAATDGIKADYVGATIDLNGFKIAGPSVCSPGSGTCSPAGSAIGVSAIGGRVINGFVTGMSGYAVVADTVEDLNVSYNNAGVRCSKCLRITARQNAGYAGIDSSQGFVKDSFAMENAGDGVKGYETSVVNVVAGYNGRNSARNLGSGISVGRSTVTASIAYSNRLAGIAASNSTVSDSVAGDNQWVGISAQGSRVHGNAVDGNATGISATFSTITNNVIQSGPNGPGYGLQIGVSPGGTTGYGGNTINFLGPWGISGTGIQIAPNICNNVLCP